MEENKYKRGKIYKIVDNTNGNIYIGSTCEPTLARRLANHITAYKQYLNGSKDNYTTSFEILKNNDYNIVLIENVPCNCKDELFKRERYYIELLTCVNKVIPGRTIHEYNKMYENKYKEKIKQYKQEYNKNFRITHSEHIKDYQNNYRLENKPKLQEYIKNYIQTHLEKCRESCRMYQEKNKAKYRKSHLCSCGYTYQYIHKSRHMKSQKHIKKMANIDNIKKLYNEADTLFLRIDNILIETKKLLSQAYKPS